jgi:ABC-type iron transport system FetAB ATPase subunit
MLLTAGPFTVVTPSGRTILDGDSLVLGDGELVVLEAPSGRGKSTLLRCVAGIIGGADANRVLRGDHYPGRRLPVWRSQVVLLAQDAPMLPGTVEENLVFPFTFRAAAERSFDADRARRELEHFDLDHLDPETDVHSLSGGERHRLALVRALLWDPTVLLADEPLSGLDGDRVQAALDRIDAFAHRPGHAVVIVQHGAEVRDRADRRIVLGPLEAA